MLEVGPRYRSVGDGFDARVRAYESCNGAWFRIGRGVATLGGGGRKGLSLPVILAEFLDIGLDSMCLPELSRRWDDERIMKSGIRCRAGCRPLRSNDWAQMCCKMKPQRVDGAAMAMELRRRSRKAWFWASKITGGISCSTL